MRSLTLYESNFLNLVHEAVFHRKFSALLTGCTTTGAEKLNCLGAPASPESSTSDDKGFCHFDSYEFQ